MEYTIFQLFSILHISTGSFVPGKQNKDKTTNVGKTDIQVIQGEIANQQVSRVSP